jgi:hypothetical protein
MRNGKVVLAAIAALILGTGSAYAFPLEVSKKIRLPAQPLKVWAIAGDFCAIKDWHPLVADCKETEEGGTTFRTLTLKDGGSIKEKLLESGDTSYSYEIIESPLPVMNYKAKFRVEKDPRDPQRTTIFWQAAFDAKGASQDEAYKKINDIFAAGLEGIKQKVLGPHGTVRGD